MDLFENLIIDKKSVAKIKDLKEEKGDFEN